MATLDEIGAQINDPALDNKIKAAAIIAAKDIKFEASGTTNHANRMIWAAKALEDPASVMPELKRYVLAANNTLSVAQLQGLSDTDVQNHVNACIDVFATG